MLTNVLYDFIIYSDRSCLEVVQGCSLLDDRVIYIVYLKGNQSIDMSSIVELSSIIVKNQLTTSDISLGRQNPSKLHKLI